jgi:hypothetical protein
LIAKDFEHILGRYARNPGEIDKRVRAVRALYDLPTIRGRHAPDLTYVQAVAMMLSLVSRRASEAGEIALKAMNLNLAPLTPMAAHYDLNTSIINMILAPGRPTRWRFTRLEIREDGEFARMDFARPGFPLVPEWNLKSIIYSNDKALRRKILGEIDRYNAADRFNCEKRLVLSCAFLDQVASDLAES